MEQVSLELGVGPDQMPDYSEMPFAANKARPSREAR